MRRADGRASKAGRWGLTLLAAASLVAAPGCVALEAYEALDDFPLAQAGFAMGAVGVGAPATAAFAPVTVPLATIGGGSGCRGGVELVLGPGLALGGIAGAAVAAPLLAVELVARFPFLVAEHLQGRARPQPAPPAPPRAAAPASRSAAPVGRSSATCACDRPPPTAPRSAVPEARRDAGAGDDALRLFLDSGAAEPEPPAGFHDWPSPRTRPEGPATPDGCPRCQAAR